MHQAQESPSKKMVNERKVKKINHKYEWESVDGLTKGQTDDKQNTVENPQRPLLKMD